MGFFPLSARPRHGHSVCQIHRKANPIPSGNRLHSVSRRMAVSSGRGFGALGAAPAPRPPASWSPSSSSPECAPPSSAKWSPSSPGLSCPHALLAAATSTASTSMLTRPSRIDLISARVHRKTRLTCCAHCRLPSLATPDRHHLLAAVVREGELVRVHEVVEQLLGVVAKCVSVPHFAHLRPSGVLVHCMPILDRVIVGLLRPVQHVAKRACVACVAFATTHPSHSPMLRSRRAMR